MAQVGPKMIHLPVAPGMHQELDAHACGPGVLRYALNVRFPNSGSCRSRPGTDVIGGSSGADVDYSEIADSGGPDFMAEVPGGFVFGKSGYGYRYDGATGSVSAAGSYSNALPLGVLDTMAREEIATSNPVPWPLSQAYASGYVATLYSCGNGQGGVGPGDGYVVLHVMTVGGALVASMNLPLSQVGYVVADGDSGNMVVMVQQGTDLRAATITLSASGATIGAFVSVGTLFSATSYWALAPAPSYGWALTYQDFAVTAKVALGIGTVAVLGGFYGFPAATVPVSVYCDGTHVFVGWVEGVGPYLARVRVYDMALSVTGGTATVQSDATAGALGPPLFGAGPGGTTLYAVSRSDNTSLTQTSNISFGTVTSASVVHFLCAVYEATALSSPFGGGYIWARVGGLETLPGVRFERAVLFDLMAVRAGANANAQAQPPVIALCGEAFQQSQQLGGGYAAGWYRHFLPTPVDTGDYWVAGIPRLVRSETSLVLNIGLSIAEWLKFRLDASRMVRKWGDLVVVPGSPTLLRGDEGSRSYDGTNSLAVQRDGTDLGFHVNPVLDAPSQSNGAGTLTPGTYMHRVVIERIDADGRRWRSAPSGIQSTVLVGPNDTITLAGRFDVTQLRAGTFGTFVSSARPTSRFVVHAYRTLAGGSEFRRATPPQGAPMPGVDGTFTYTDTLEDSKLIREFLYTDGNVLQNDMAPSARFVAVTEDRIWLAGLWDVNQLASSKVIVPGEPPQFTDHPSHRVVLPAPCTGIAAQDGIVVAFTAQGIYAIQGAGPTDQGQGAWESPREVTRSCGCINELSIVETSAGIFFQASRGIYLLPRGLGEPVFIGAPVQDLPDQLPSPGIESAAFCRDTNTVRFVIGEFVVVFDLTTNAWSLDGYAEGAVGVCDSDRGAVIALASPTASSKYFRRESEIAEGDDEAATEPECIMQFGKLHPFGVAGWGTVGAGIALFEELNGLQFPQGEVTISIAVDDADPSTVTYSMAAFDDRMANYRKLFTDTVRQGSAFELQVSVEGLGWRYVGATLEAEDLGGTRRMQGNIFPTTLVTESLETLLTEDGEALITEGS
jgi:hypothetical protein